MDHTHQTSLSTIGKKIKTRYKGKEKYNEFWFRAKRKRGLWAQTKRTPPFSIKGKPTSLPR